MKTLLLVAVLLTAAPTYRYVCPICGAIKEVTIRKPYKCADCQVYMVERP